METALIADLDLTPEEVARKVAEYLAADESLQPGEFTAAHFAVAYEPPLHHSTAQGRLDRAERAGLLSKRKAGQRWVYRITSG